MQGMIKGFSMFHSGTWYRDDDVNKERPQAFQSLFVMDRSETGPVMHKVKVPKELAASASQLDEKVVELVVDIKSTNYGGKSGTEFHLVRAKVA